MVLIQTIRNVHGVQLTHLVKMYCADPLLTQIKETLKVVPSNECKRERLSLPNCFFGWFSSKNGDAVSVTAMSSICVVL